MNYGDVTSVGSLGGIREYAKSKGISVKKAKKELEGVDAYTLYRPVRRKFKRQKIVGHFINELHIADLAEMFQEPFLPEHNDGYRYLLIIVDALSRRCFIRPLKNKKSETVCESMREIYTNPANRCDLLLTDEGKEFEGACKKLYRDFNINHYHTHSVEIKGSHAERKILDVKRMIMRYLHFNNSRRYVHILDAVERNLNGRIHRIIGMAPSDVNPLNETKVFEKSIRTIGTRVKFKIGDHVRISRIKGRWDKAHRGSWSREIYSIYKTDKNVVRGYHLKDLEEEKISGKFFAEELQRVTLPDFFEIEDIIETKKVGKVTKYLVTFKGYPPKPMWVTDLKKIKT